MKTVIIEQAGGIEQMKVREVTDLKIKDGWLTIDVAYAGVGYVDVLMRKGAFVDVFPFPVTPGLEVSGYVRAIGKGVEGFYVGQPVASLTLHDAGGYASQAYVRPDLTVPLDRLGADLDLATAAAAIVNLTTAYIAAKEIHQTRKGEHVLVHGAAGGLGSFIGQIAKLFGAGRVFGTVGNPEKIRLASSLGYDELYLRSELSERALTATDSDRVDVVFDTTGGEVQRQSRALLRPLGQMVILGNASGQVVNYTNTDIWPGNQTISGFTIGGMSEAYPKRVGQAAKEALKLLANKQVHTEIYGVYPLEQAGDTHILLEGKNTTGKLVLEI